MQTNKTLTLDDLLQFTGSCHWYRHGLVRSIVFTDGAKFLADRAGAYWLLDEIALAQRRKSLAAEPFPLWRLRVQLDEATRTLVCEDGNGKAIYRKAILYTDFPLAEVVLYLAERAILCQASIDRCAALWLDGFATLPERERA